MLLDLVKFGGIMPRVKDPLLLPEGRSQVAKNCRFDQGGIKPLRQNKSIDITRSDVTSDLCSMFLYRGLEIDALQAALKIGPISHVFLQNGYLYVANVEDKRIYIFSYSADGLELEKIKVISYLGVSPAIYTNRCITGDGTYIYVAGGNYIYCFSDYNSTGEFKKLSQINVGYPISDTWSISGLAAHFIFIAYRTDSAHIKVASYQADSSSGSLTLIDTSDTITSNDSQMRESMVGFRVNGSTTAFLYIHYVYTGPYTKYYNIYQIETDGTLTLKDTITDSGLTNPSLHSSYGSTSYVFAVAYMILCAYSVNTTTGALTLVASKEIFSPYFDYYRGGFKFDGTYIYVQANNWPDDYATILTLQINGSDMDLISYHDETLLVSSYPDYPKSLDWVSGYVFSNELGLYSVTDGVLTGIDELNDGELFYPPAGYTDTLGNTRLYFFMWNQEDIFGDINAVESPVIGESYKRVYFTKEGTFCATDKDLFDDGGTDYPMATYPPSPPAPATPCSISGTASGDDPTLIETRGYVYTYINKYGSQGPPSLISNLLDLYDGNTCYISGIAVAPTDADYSLTKKRIYRINQGSSDAAYQYVDEIDINTTTYTDIKTDASLGEVLPSLLWDQALEGIKGLISVGNVLWGFVENYACASVPLYPHAWPRTSDYQKPFPYKVVGLGTFGTTVVVTTEGEAYLIVGANDPPTAVIEKVDGSRANICKRGIVSAPFGVMYPTPEGICLISNTVSLPSEIIIDRDDWFETYGKYLRSAFLWENHYLGFCYNDGTDEGFGFIFDPFTKNLSTFEGYANGGYYDKLTGELFLAIRAEDKSSTSIHIFDKDATSSCLTMEYIGKRDKFLPGSPKIVKVMATDYPVNFSLTDQNSTFACDVVSYKPQRINEAKGLLIDSAEIKLQGTNQITAVYVSSTMGELPV